MNWADKRGMRVVIYFGSLWLLSGLAGCGEGGDEFPTGTVSGKVTFDGKPVTEGKISFINEELGYGAGATLGSDGSYQLEEGRGIRLGDYKVAVRPPLVGGSPEDPDDPPKPKEMPNIPEKYRQFETSGLSAAVKEGGNEFTFDLKDE